MADSPRTVFMGTPDFAVPSLDALVAADLAPVAVVTVPDKPAGRGQSVRASAVKKAAERHGLPVLQPASLQDEAFHDALRALRPDILAVVAFRILPPEVYEAATLGAFNLHGSLLPAYRGAAPIQRALMDGVAETGVTTFFLQKTVDTGNVILRRRLAVGPDDTAGDVHDRLAALGAEAVVETVRRIAAGEAHAEPQDDALASPAPKLFRDDARIDWSRPARAVHDHVRALSPYPGAWTAWAPAGERETLKVLRTRVDAEGGAVGAAGAVVEADGRLVVACGEGAVEVLEVQRQGKRRMSVADFLNGADLGTGAVLGE
ncbi:methionyl-tRNA formyltransferase [Rubrivirga sp. S365]|uniref:Methionyl-tRNA formyltransferase n=1 Tax=Rubrivirga litoralis TaxID=3075598 RepID=A0ABU3BSP7_9BACT|nr:MULTISPECIES: methionyl-tRNA formyltransferase [unclassified Rubrivirga]MDT0632313.1 methionyl-tRNA formyltransferase [Rubrivirga sp. F394]MDT7856302.1 methionyl-tRNA formyltransferase [Rubrivirga sp. S365]